MTESNEKTLWAQFNWYDPAHPWIVLDPESEDELSYCEECPCPTPPACVPCDLHIGYWGYTWTNYQEIWGVGCDEDCDTEIHLLGTYDERDTLGVLGKSGCMWAEVDNTYACLHWYGVDRACMPYHICDQRICDQDTCDIRKHSILNYCNAQGFYCNASTGWLYPTGNPANLTPVTYHWITWFYYEEDNRYQATLHYLDCNCLQEDLASGSFIGTPPSSPADFGYSFVADGVACTPGCESTISAFIAQARENGWTLYGEGLLVRKTSAAYSCYRCDMGIVKVQMCADTGSSFVYISCSCTRGTIDVGWEDSYEGTVNLYEIYTFLEYAGCACYSIRELLLSYPEMFGVQDVSFGDDTVYTREYDSQYYDYDTGQWGPVTHNISTTAGIESSHGWDSYWVDYRNMYIIFDNTCIGYSQSSYGSTNMPTVFVSKLNVNDEWRSRYSVNHTPIYDSLTDGDTEFSKTSNSSIVFDGHVPPFTSMDDNRSRWPNLDSRCQWQGLTIRWSAYNQNAGSETFWNESDARKALADVQASSNPYGTDEIYPGASGSTYFYPPAPSEGPSAFYTVFEGTVSQTDPQDPYSSWEVEYPRHDWTKPYVFNLNFVTTNKGFLVNGQSGYSDTLSVPGYVNAIPYYYPTQPTEQSVIDAHPYTWAMCELPSPEGYSPDSEICPAGTVRGITFKSGIYNVPFYNMTYQITDIDESMGGCQDDDWWPTDEGEEPEEPIAQ